MSAFASVWHFAWFRNVGTGELVNFRIPDRFQQQPWLYHPDGHVFHGFLHDGPRMFLDEGSDEVEGDD